MQTPLREGVTKSLKSPDLRHFRGLTETDCEGRPLTLWFRDLAWAERPGETTISH